MVGVRDQKDVLCFAMHTNGMYSGSEAHLITHFLVMNYTRKYCNTTTTTTNNNNNNNIYKGKL